MQCCGAAPDVVSRESYGQSFVVTLGRCARCETYTWSTQLAPQVPWINAVQRAVLGLQAAMLKKLYGS